MRLLEVVGIYAASVMLAVGSADAASERWGQDDGPVEWQRATTMLPAEAPLPAVDSGDEAPALPLQRERWKHGGVTPVPPTTARRTAVARHRDETMAASHRKLPHGRRSDDPPH